MPTRYWTILTELPPPHHAFPWNLQVRGASLLILLRPAARGRMVWAYRDRRGFAVRQTSTISSGVEYNFLAGVFTGDERFRCIAIVPRWVDGVNLMNVSIYGL